MTKNIALRATFALFMFILGNLQAWDSDVHQAGLWIVLLVSVAIALPPVAILIPLKQFQYLATFALSFLLLGAARILSPIPLPGLFLVLAPAILGLVFTGIFSRESDDAPTG